MTERLNDESTADVMMNTMILASNINAHAIVDGVSPPIMDNFIYNQMLSNSGGMPLDITELYRQQSYFPPSQMGQLPPAISGVSPFVLGPSTEQLKFALHPKMFGYRNVKEKKGGLRKGKWTLEEENYTNKIIEVFNTSLLQLPSESNGITLRTYLAEKLNCDPMRITKKYAGASCLGKRVYHATLSNRVNPEILAKTQAELAELEVKFNEKVEYSASEKEMVDHADNNASGKVRSQNPLVACPMGYSIQVPHGMCVENFLAPGILFNNYAQGGSKVGIPMPLFPGIGILPPFVGGEAESPHQYNYLHPYFQSLYQSQSVPRRSSIIANINNNSTSSDSRNSDSRSDSSSNSNEENEKNTKDKKVMSTRMSTTSSSSAATTKSSSNRGYTQNGKKESNSDSGSGRGSGSRGSGSRGSGSGSGSDGDRGSGSGSDEGSRSGSGSDENGNRSHQLLSNQSLYNHNQINVNKNYSHNKGGRASSDKSTSEKSDEDNFAASNLLVGFINHVISVSQSASNDPNLVNESNRRNAVLAAAAAAAGGGDSSYSGYEEEPGSGDQASKKRKVPKLSSDVIAVVNINPIKPS